MNKAISLLFTFLFMLLLTGCWDSQDLEQRTSVIGIGIDLEKKENKKYLVTAQIPIPLRIMGGGGGEHGKKEAVKVMSMTGDTLWEASTNLQKRVNHELFYGHDRILVFSEEVARQGMKEILDNFRRGAQVRRLLFPMVVAGSAEDFMHANPRMEQIPTFFILDLLKSGVDSDRIPDLTLGKVLNDLSDSTVQPIMNYVSASREGVKWNGVAVFKNDKMIGNLKPDEVWALIQLRENKRAGEIDVPCPGNQQGNGSNLVSYRPKTIKVKREFYLNGLNSYRAVYRVRLEGDIIESQCGLDFSKMETITKIEKELTKGFLQRGNHLIATLQKEFKSDVLRLGTLARAKYPEWWSKEKWEAVFPEGQIQLQYEVHIRRTGMEMK